MKTRPADFRIELGYLRDNLIAAAQDRKTSLLEEGLEVYENLVSSFIEKLSHWGSYDKKHAMQEVTSIGGDWSEIKWINDDLRELIHASIGAENPYILRQIFGLLYRLANNALAARDYYIFYRFMLWFPYLYNSSNAIKESSVRKSVVSQTYLGPQEIGEHFILPQIERARSVEELSKIKDFAKAIVIVFNQLLKNAYEAKSISDFETFAQALMGVFPLYGRITRQFHDQFVMSRVKQRTALPASPEREAELDEESAFAKARVDVMEELEEYKGLVFFGFGAWLLQQYEEKKLIAEQFSQWYGHLPKVLSLGECWRLYSKANDDQVKQDFGWDWWDISGRSQPVASWGRVGQGMELLFVIRSLEIVKQMPAPERVVASLPLSQDLPALAQNADSPLQQLLAQLERHANRWAPVLGQDTLGSIPAFKEILSRSVSSQRRKEAETVVAAPLSAEKVRKVGQSILKGWKDNALIRQLIREAGTYQSGLEAPNGAPFFGINQRDRKGIYAEGSQIFFEERWGEQYGSAIARGENELVLKKLAETSRPTGEAGTGQKDLLECLDTAVAELRRSGYDPVILALNSWQIETILENRDGFTPAPMGQNSYWQLGDYRRSKVYRFRYAGAPRLVGVDLKKVGRWLQFKPTRSSEDESTLGDDFLFFLRPITREQAMQLLEKAPQLRGERGLEEALLELQQQVHLRVIEQFEYEITNVHATFALEMPDETGRAGSF